MAWTQIVGPLADSEYVFNQVTGAAYTLVLTDAGKIVELNHTSAITITIPLDATVAFPVGTEIQFVPTGVGTVTVAAIGGVTLNSKSGQAAVPQWGLGRLIKRATNTWLWI